MKKRLYKAWLYTQIVTRKFYLAEIKFYIDLWQIRMEKRRKNRAVTLANELSQSNRGERYYVLKNSIGKYYVMNRKEFKMREKLAYKKNSYRKKQNFDSLLKDAVYITPNSYGRVEIHKEYIRQTKKS